MGVTGVQTCALPISIFCPVVITPVCTATTSPRRFSSGHPLEPADTGTVCCIETPAPGTSRYADTIPSDAEYSSPSGLLTVNSRSRSEEHTSELQSRQYLVCRLLLEK